jgi:(p)ppGpp synthase/HD superfamily hydrolase
VKGMGPKEIDYVDVAMGFAACAHKDQKRKYTNEPYVVHCKAVMNRVAEYTDDIATICAAVLHDTIEDTSVTKADIALVFGEEVADLVMEVTDLSKPEDGNRKARKQIDRDHLAGCSPQGATIKLADLIDNTSSIVKYDEDFAKVYLAEKEALLPLLKHGDADLWRLANDTLQHAKSKLAENGIL